MLDKVEVLRKENTDVLDINLHQNEDVKNEQHLELFRFLGQVLCLCCYMGVKHGV